MPVPGEVVYIHEHFEFDRRGPIATGLFDCELRGPGDEWLGVYAEPPLAFADALAWARSRADRVSVRITGDRDYSAGRDVGPDPRVDESAVFSRRRPPGWEFLDRTESDPAIWWDVVVDVATQSASQIASEGKLTELGEGWLVALRSACKVVEITTTGADGRSHTQTDGKVVWWTGFGTTPVAVVRVEAGGWMGARNAATQAAGRAAREIEWMPVPTFSAEHAFATGSQVAQRNARLDTDGVGS